MHVPMKPLCRSEVLHSQPGQPYALPHECEVLQGGAVRKAMHNPRYPRMTRAHFERVTIILLVGWRTGLVMAYGSWCRVCGEFQGRASSRSIQQVHAQWWPPHVDARH
jgi:hypothetical protein